MGSFDTELVTNPGHVFSSNNEGGTHHPISVVEFGDEGSSTRVKNAAGNRLPVQVAQGLSAVGVVSGQISLSGAVAALTTVAARRFRIKADNDNTAKIFIGPAGTTTGNGFPLSPGDTLDLEVSNLDVIFAIVASGTQVLHYFGHI